MLLLRKLRKTIGLLVMSAMLSLSLSAPGYAAMVGTEDILAADSVAQERDYIREMLNRDEVQDQLTSLGVDPAEAQQRVDAMTEEEVQMLAGQLEEMPAGGSALGLLAFVLIVLLITDLLGFTNVYNI